MSYTESVKNRYYGCLRINVKYDPPPIPVRDMDWCAWIDGKEELGTWHGATHKEAIASLKEDPRWDGKEVVFW